MDLYNVDKEVKTTITGCGLEDARSGIYFGRGTVSRSEVEASGKAQEEQ